MAGNLQGARATAVTPLPGDAATDREQGADPSEVQAQQVVGRAEAQ